MIVTDADAGIRELVELGWRPMASSVVVPAEVLTCDLSADKLEEMFAHLHTIFSSSNRSFWPIR